jgi:hypothetical protein
MIETGYHRLYIQSMNMKKERYSYKKDAYESISNNSAFLYGMDRRLKKRKILHAIFFNKLLFWNKPLFRETPSHKRFRIYIGGFKSESKDLYTLFYELREATLKDKLELVINSHGGSIEEGRQFFNLIQEKFYGRTVAYLDNHAYSMGATLFCMADKKLDVSQL